MIFDRPSREPLPDKQFGDVQHAAGKAFASLVPGLGEAFGLVLASPIERRRADWFRDLEARLRELENCVEGFRFDDLGQNEQFVSATLQATQAALRTHQKQKLEALRNAVANVAQGREPSADRQQQFISLVDRFSETHLVLLHFFKDPAAYFQSRGKPVPRIELQTKLLAHQLVCNAMPELRDQTQSPSQDRTAASFQFIELILRELVSAKLIALEPLNETWAVPKFDQNPATSPVKPLTTHLGEDFLAFVAGPPAETR
jgi:hypothetical protein